MNSLENFYNIENALLLVAPPGWGKTYKLLDWAQNSTKSFIYLSPLRALSEEIYKSASDLMSDVHFTKTRSEFEKMMKENSYFKFLIVGFEVFNLKKEFDQKNTIVVLDEFHLIYHWGRDFRPILFDTYIDLVVKNYKLLFLSATMKKENLESLPLELESCYYLDLGNHQLKNEPQKTFYYPKKWQALLYDNLKLQIEIGASHTILVFCPYREEVKRLHYLYQKDYSVLSCVGGEAREFSRKLSSLHSPPDIIFSTTCLSHGVNLPKISHIFFLYEVKDLDFFIQMTGRGGRKGEEFVVHCLENRSKTLLEVLFISMILRLKFIWEWVKW